jgi:hypothetical protein
MEARPNDPGMLGTDREEGRSSRVSSSKGTIAACPQKIGTGLEEDWSFLGTDDPAFWLKEPDQE